MATEAQARADGDAATLASANQHSQQLVDAEAKARADGDAATLADAKAHTDQTVATEAQAVEFFFGHRRW